VSTTPNIKGYVQSDDDTHAAMGDLMRRDIRNAEAEAGKPYDVNRNRVLAALRTLRDSPKP
jgi:hypothetical protein